MKSIIPLMWINSNTARIYQTSFNNGCSYAWIIQSSHFNSIFIRISPVNSSWYPINSNTFWWWNVYETRIVKYWVSNGLKVFQVHCITFTNKYFLISSIIFWTINLFCRYITPINTTSWTIVIDTYCHLYKNFFLIKIENQTKNKYEKNFFEFSYTRHGNRISSFSIKWNFDCCYTFWI